MRCLLILTATAALAQTLTIQKSGVAESLRGVSAVNATTAWASGTHGTFLRTLDGGATWMAGKVAGAEQLDFRDVEAIDANTAYLLSIGTGETSRVYKTTDGGEHWKLALLNPDAKGFFDEMAFWTARHGILVGDPVDGQLVVMTTEDGGLTWQRQKMPPAAPNEGVFAASGTGIAVAGESDVWIGTGGAGARVFHSGDSGRTWTVVSTPIRGDSPNAGIFSLAFRDALHGVAVGGDYRKTQESAGVVAVTADGGKTWTVPVGAPPKGFRSGVAYLVERKAWIAVGTTGADVSTNDGQNWQQFDTGNYNAVAIFSKSAGWAVGPGGAIARLQME